MIKLRVLGLWRGRTSCPCFHVHNHHFGIGEPLHLLIESDAIDAPSLGVRKPPLLPGMALALSRPPRSRSTSFAVRAPLSLLIQCTNPLNTPRCHLAKWVVCEVGKK